MEEGVFSFLVNYVVYICAGILFAMLSALMVIKLAPFAAGSGIAEVCKFVSFFYYFLLFCLFLSFST